MTPEEGARAPGGLPRSLGRVSLTFYGVGMILGAGIYSVIGEAAGVAGDALWQSLVVASICALVTGLSYAELASAWPEAGAEYAYLRHAAPRARMARFLTGFVIAFAGAATAATVAMSFAGYAAEFVESPRGAVAAVLVVACALVNALGIRTSSGVNATFTLIEVAGLILVIWVATRVPGFGDALAAPPHPGVLPGAALIFFAFLGFEEIANLAEETRDPGRDLPFAILVSMAVATTLYVLVAVGLVALQDPAVLAESKSPLAGAVAQAAPRLRPVLAAAALFATANTALVALLVSSRMVLGIARAGDLPKALARTSGKAQSPLLALGGVTVVALGLLPLADVGLVASVSSAASLLGFLVVNVCVVLLRRRKPDQERPFRVPLAVANVPLLPVAGILAICVLMTQFEREVYLAGAGALAVAVMVWFAWGRRGGERTPPP